MSQPVLASPLDLNEPIDPCDPFPYGWRYVQKGGKNGSEAIQVPLTLEDILHPQEEDFRLLSDLHTEDCYYLRTTFRAALGGTPGALVLNDCRVAWDRDGKIGHGPDCAVIFKVRKKKDWSTFNVVKEKAKPVLIVEVTSPSTRSTDLVNKVIEYAKHGVPHYVIADARRKRGERQLSLIDYHLTPVDGGGHAYYTLPLDDEGRVWLAEVNLWLGAEDGRLVCWDVKGVKVKTSEERQQARVEEHQARIEAEKRADALEARVKELEQQTRRKSGHNGRNGA